MLEERSNVTYVIKIHGYKLLLFFAACLTAYLFVGFSLRVHRIFGGGYLNESHKHKCHINRAGCTALWKAVY